MAHFSKDPVLVDAFRNGEDIHARTAQEVFGVGPLAQTAEHRRAAKAINFASFMVCRRLGSRSSWASNKKKRPNSSTRISRVIAA